MKKGMNTVPKAVKSARKSHIAINPGEKVMILNDIVEVIACESIIEPDEGGTYTTVRYKDLSSDYLRSDIKLDNIFNSPKYATRMLAADALLCGYNEVDIRVARLTNVVNKIGLGKGIIAFKIKSQGIVTEDFLLRALTLEKTNKQLQIYGSDIPREFPDKIFLNLEIAVPTLERQNEIYNEESREKLSEMDRKLLEEHEDYRRDVHMKKHAIGQTIHNFGNWWSLLQMVRKEGKGIVDDNALFGKLNPTRVADIYQNIQNAVEQLTHQIHSFDRGYGMESENIALTEFIEDYIEKHQNPLFSYEYDPLSHRHQKSMHSISEIYDDKGNVISYSQDDGYIFKKGDPIEYAKFPVEALTIIFDNIISNACAHGFAGREMGNKVKIDVIRCEGCEYAITIANNGRPINPQLTDKDVFTYGKTSQGGNNHFGIGGYEVYRLMKEFNGDAELILSPNGEYPVTYKLIFKETNIVARLGL